MTASVLLETFCCDKKIYNFKSNYIPHLPCGHFPIGARVKGAAK